MVVLLLGEYVNGDEDALQAFCGGFDPHFLHTKIQYQMTEVAQVKLPTVGRAVHYFPNETDKHSQANGATVLPATVVQTFEGPVLNLLVVTMNQDGPVVLRFSVPHKSSPLADNGFSYWDWPEIK